MKVDRNLKQAKERGIAVCRYPKSKGDLYNKWWRYCKSLGLPFVVVIPGGKYSTVVIDSFSTGWRNSEGLPLNEEEMRKVDEENFEKILPVINIVMLLYAPLLVGYTNQRLKKEVLIERLSELSIFNDSMPHKIKRSIRPLLDISEGIPACPE